MATNRAYSNPSHLPLATTDPTTPASGDPVRVGPLTGVALTAKGDGGNAATDTSVDVGLNVYRLSVKGVDDAGNVAVAVGDQLFYVDADTPKLSKKGSGRYFGIALEAVTSGATTTIMVFHAPTAGPGVQRGFIPIPLASFREIASNDTINTAGDAGVLSKNTTPIFERVNAATDKQLRINWAASNSDEIVASFPYPPDLDDAAPVVVHLLMRSGGATDTPTVAVSYFEGVGDTNAGGNTAALSATVADKTVVIAASDVGAYPNYASIGLVVGAHTTDAVFLYGAWIEYVKK